MFTHIKRRSLPNLVFSCVIGLSFFYRHYWLWGAILAPILGAVMSGGLYHVFLRQPEDMTCP